MTSTEPVPLQWFKDHLPPQIEIMGLPNFLSPESCRSLSSLLGMLGGRKHVFNYPYPLSTDIELPGQIAEAALLADRFKTPTNMAILKRYDVHDVPRSTAYEQHTDPEIFRTQRLVLITLSGSAELTLTTSDGETKTLPCEPGTAFFVDPETPHSVTEPLNTEGVRDFLFLGYAKPM
jgi:oxalate decarboxylase/phosphoglucose isomerase-like protein (cupin superfamily)